MGPTQKHLPGVGRLYFVGRGGFKMTALRSSVDEEEKYENKDEYHPNNMCLPDNSSSCMSSVGGMGHGGTEAVLFLNGGRGTGSSMIFFCSSVLKKLSSTITKEL